MLIVPKLDKKIEIHAPVEGEKLAGVKVQKEEQ